MQMAIEAADPGKHIGVAMPVHERMMAHTHGTMVIIGVELKARDQNGYQSELEMFVPKNRLIVPLHRNLYGGGYGSGDFIESFPITIHTNVGDVNLQGY